mmetsp:Transcript_29555/g.41903  ORF Transcript_29555/g.41903 Transcript_29555/m.41903 type:complete len:260 (-) Transcript_29555:128-907(-)
MPAAAAARKTMSTTAAAYISFLLMAPHFPVCSTSWKRVFFSRFSVDCLWRVDLGGAPGGGAPGVGVPGGRFCCCCCCFCCCRCFCCCGVKGAPGGRCCPGTAPGFFTLEATRRGALCWKAPGFLSGEEAEAEAAAAAILDDDGGGGGFFRESVSVFIAVSEPGFLSRLVSAFLTTSACDFASLRGGRREPVELGLDGCLSGLRAGAASTATEGGEGGGEGRRASVSEPEPVPEPEGVNDEPMGLGLLVGDDKREVSSCL